MTVLKLAAEDDFCLRWRTGFADIGARPWRRGEREGRG